MAVFNMIEEADATGKVKEVFEDIKKKRNTDYINNFWKMLANNPETLERTWTKKEEKYRLHKQFLENVSQQPRNFRENLDFYTASDEKRCFG